MIKIHKHIFSFCAIAAVILTFQASALLAIAPEIPDDLKQFLDKFSEAVINQNTELVMAMMDSDYRKEQHDAFLKGNTQQFLDKFFCGYDPVDGETYECIRFKEVVKLELSSVMPETDLYIVLFHVTDTDSTVEVTWIVSALPDGGTIKYGMIGTYG